MVKGVLTVSAPMKDRILPDQCMQRAGDCCKILHISPVIPIKTKEGADFSGGFGRRDLPDGREERWIWEEAFFRNLVLQITDLFGGEGAFFCPQLEVCVPQPLEDLAKTGEVLLPRSGEDNNVVEIEEARFLVETREDAIHEAGEGGGSIAETKRDFFKLVQLPTAGTKRRFFLIPLHDRDLPVPTL